MSLKIQLVITGPDKPGEDLRLIATRAKDAKPAMKAILAVLVEGERREFASSGAAGGRAWEKDRQTWDDRKREQGKSTQPERYTDAMMKALTEDGAEGAIRRVNRQSAVLGTTIFYSRFQKNPVLSTLRYVPGVVSRAQDIVVEWLMNGTVTA